MFVEFLKTFLIFLTISLTFILFPRQPKPLPSQRFNETKLLRLQRHKLIFCRDFLEFSLTFLNFYTISKETKGVTITTLSQDNNLASHAS